MKIYVIEYDTKDFSNNKVHHIEKLLEYELQDRIECIGNNPYVENLKRYEADLKEVDKFTLIF